MPVSYAFKIPAILASAVALYLLTFASFGTFIFFGLPILAGVASALILRRLDPKRTTADHITDALRVYWGLHLIWSAARYWFTDGQPAVPHPVGGPFIDSLVAMGLFLGIKTLEGFIGIMLVLNRYVPLVLVLEVPTSFTIFYLNFFIVGEPRQLLTGPLELAANGALLLCYFRYYQPFLTARAYAAPPRFMARSALDGDAATALKGPGHQHFREV
jgi:hypothetical protein